jgi:acyl-CoA synthetase (AMP-forming)/AMP-acid ligase II
MPTQIARSPTLLFAPLFHASGTFSLLLSVFEGRPVVVFEKFKVAALRDALQRYPVRFLSMPPAVLRMVLDSALTREDLKTIIAVRAGTAPLDPQVQAEFEERFGVPVLTTYGATEFMGALARWTIADHQAFAAAKRGSVGRISPGVDLRIIDPETDAPAAADGAGLIEVRGSRVGSKDWIRTNDLGRLDADGFLWIVGRADDAIIRGGFKVLANEVAKVLCQHGGVSEAAVIGLADKRLGEVPVAAVEPREGVTPPTPEELTEFVRARLAPYQVPAEILVVPKLPRTVSLKISRPDVRALFESRSAPERIA